MAETTYTAKDWDQVRTSFASSIMVDTAISSLAENLDGPAWPVKGKDETPAQYIDLGFNEARELLALKGQPPERLDQLIGILRETLAFDNPFGEMVQQAAAASDRENPLLKNMAKLGLPENFPIELTLMGSDTVEFCKLEKLSSLGEFAIFAQTMSQNVIVGGDFRKLLNALSHVDEAVLAQMLPYRKAERGLHFIEAVAQATRTPAPEARAALAASWFKEERDALARDLEAGGNLGRHLLVLMDPPLERRTAELMRPLLKAAPVAGAGQPRKSGFLSGLAGLFRSKK